jgi:hypothetical protein
MTTHYALITADDFTSVNFPEFQDGDIMNDVLLELNTVVQSAIAEQDETSANSDVSSEELIECLREDIIGSPYLYLSSSLIDRLKTI